MIDTFIYISAFRCVHVWMIPGRGGGGGGVGGENHKFYRFL